MQDDALGRLLSVWWLSAPTVFCPMDKCRHRCPDTKTDAFGVEGLLVSAYYAIVRRNTRWLPSTRRSRSLVAVRVMSIEFNVVIGPALAQPRSTRGKKQRRIEG